MDDGWQACGTGINGSFHDASGAPLFNKTLFPDVKGMNDKIHSLGLSTDWVGKRTVRAPRLSVQLYRKHHVAR